MPLNTSRLVNLASGPRITAALAGNKFQGESLSATRANRDLARESVRVRNENVGLQNQELRNQLEQEPALQAIRQKAVAGDKLAEYQLFSQRPEQWAKLKQATTQMSAEQRKVTLQRNEGLANQLFNEMQKPGIQPAEQQKIKDVLALLMTQSEFMKAFKPQEPPTPGQGQFTLGDTRFGPSGDVIAKNEKPDEPEKVSTKNVKLDDGRVVAATVSQDGTVRVGTRVLEPGKFSFISQQASGTPGDFQGTKSQIGEDLRQAEFVGRTIAQIDSIISAVENDPTLVGIPGAVRRAGQTLTGSVADISSVITDEQANEATTIGQSLLEDTELTEEQKQSFFNDPNISKLRLFENNVGLALARTRHPSGRVPVDIIKRSINDAKLIGFTSSRDVINRLNEIRSEMQKVQSGLTTRTNREAPSFKPATQQVRPTSEMTDEEMEAEIAVIKAGISGR